MRIWRFSTADLQYALRTVIRRRWAGRALAGVFISPWHGLQSGDQFREACDMTHGGSIMRRKAFLSVSSPGARTSPVAAGQAGEMS